MLHNRLAKSICIVSCICFLQTIKIYAQDPSTSQPDSLKLDFRQAEKMFLDNNLQLLAQHYNIQSSQALVEQAKKWDNPVLIADQNVYANKKFFHHGTDANGNPDGEVYAQVQQLIKTAGKRGKQVDLARTNVTLAEWQFKGTMRSLRAALYKDFYTVVQLQGVANVYKENMAQLQRLMGAQEQAFKAGNIAKKEYLRVQALIVSLKQDMAENAKSISDAESELKTLLRITGNTFVQPVADEAESADMPTVSILQLIDTAKRYNTDYQQETTQLLYNMQNLKLQKALSVPDITVSPEFDQAASYTPNYFGLTLSLPIPLWDRNQGNIKSARTLVKKEETLVSQADQKLQNDVLNSYQKLMYALKLSAGDNSKFYTEYYQLQKNILESYNNRQIGLIEFLDYYKDYQDIRQKQLQQVLNLRLAKQDLNDIVGKDIIQ